MSTWIFTTQKRPLILLMIILTAIWSASIHGSFIAIDTQWLVVENSVLQNASWSTINKIWTDFSIGTRLTLGAEFLPVRDTTVLIDFILFGTDWRWHHIHSLLWYAISCGLLWQCSVELFGRSLWSWLGCLLFLMHPTHVESVAWLASRKDVVSLSFGLLALWLYLKNTSLIRVAGILLLSYWAKNTAVVFAPMLVLLSVFHHKESVKCIQWWLKWWPIVVVYSLGLFVTMKVGQSVAMFAEPRGSTALETINIAIQTWTQYAEMLVWPTNLSLFYVEPTAQPWTTTSVILGLTIGTGVLCAPIFTNKTHPKFSLSMWVIPLGLLPVSQISPIQNLVADRYLLIPTIGFVWCITYIGQRLTLHWRWAIPYCLLLGWETIDRIPVFHSTEFVWKDVIAKQPEERRAWVSLAAIYRDSGRIQEAQSVLNQAEKHLSPCPELDLANGLLAMQFGNHKTALVLIEKAWKENDDLRVAGYNLAIIQSKENPQTALITAQRLTEIHPLYANGWSALGNVCLSLETWKCAESSFEQAHNLEPFNATHLINMGSTHYLQGNWIATIQWWETALQIAPDNQYIIEGLQSARRKLE